LPDAAISVYVVAFERKKERLVADWLLKKCVTTRGTTKAWSSRRRQNKEIIGNIIVKPMRLITGWL
jgi:hypothetical protein